MHAKHENAQPVYETPKVMGLKLLETDTTEFVELTLLKGGNIPSHSLDIPVSFYVIEGRGTLAIDGKESVVGCGDMATSEAGTTRELTNAGEGDLKVLVIKHKLQS